jgi:hypothetical protein
LHCARQDRRQCLGTEHNIFRREAEVRAMLLRSTPLQHSSCTRLSRLVGHLCKNGWWQKIHDRVALWMFARYLTGQGGDGTADHS